MKISYRMISGTFKKSGRLAVKICSISILLMIFSFSGNPAFAYDPPIGIPDPGTGWGVIHPIDTEAPPWPTGWPGSEVLNNYYIDSTHFNATDIGNTYGYPDKPRASIPEITYAAGAYVEVHGGPYTDKYINLAFNGTQQNPCWFRGTAEDMPTIIGIVYVKNSSYVFLEYLDFNGGSETSISVNGSGDHISIRNMQIRNKTYIGNRAGVSILPDVGKKMHDVVVYNNNFENMGDWNTDIDQDFHGVVPSLWGRDSTTENYNIWILENTCYHISGNCVQVNSGNWPESYKYLHHIYIGKNTAHAQRQAGFWSKQASDVIISQNEVYDNRRHGAQMGDCFGYQYRPENLWIIYNICHDVNFGIRQTAGDNWGAPTNSSYIIGNVFYNIKPEDLLAYSPTDYWRTGVAMSFWQGDMNRYVVDNIIFDSYNGINAIQTGTDGSTLEISGNIISDIDAQSYHLSIHENVDQDVDVLKNVLHDPDGTFRIRWEGTEYTDLASFKNAKAECLSCEVFDPEFVDPAVQRFDLKSTSKAIDAGTKHSAYDTFQALYGIDLKKDIRGKARPYGQGWDLGAVEAAPATVIIQQGTVQ